MSTPLAFKIRDSSELNRTTLKILTANWRVVVTDWIKGGCTVGCKVTRLANMCHILVSVPEFHPCCLSYGTRGPECVSSRSTLSVRGATELLFACPFLTQNATTESCPSSLPRWEQRNPTRRHRHTHTVPLASLPSTVRTTIPTMPCERHVRLPVARGFRLGSEPGIRIRSGCEHSKKQVM